VSNSPYGPSSGDLPPDDDHWFRPAPATPREEIYRESEYGPSTYGPPPAYEQDPFDQPVSSYEQSPFGGQPAPSYGQQEPIAQQAPYGQQDPFGQDLYAPPPPPPPPPAAGGLNALQSLGRPMDAPGGSTDLMGYDDEPAYAQMGSPAAYDSPGSYEYPDGPGLPGGPAGPGPYGPGGGGFGGPEDPDEPAAIGRRKKPKRTGWKRYVPNWKVTVGVITLGTLGLTTLVVVGYYTTPTPSLEKGGQLQATAQGTNVYWANNKKTPMFQLGEPRENVDISKIPKVVQYAVMAAEQRDFYTDPGVSPRGMARAVYKTMTGGDVEGGSTITQQLARNYLKGLSQDRSLSRKYKEIFAAIKLDDAYSKDKILETYLNTIPFGRNSLGIQAASHAYFHTDVKNLKVNQAALLAAMIQQPGYFHTQGDPKKDPALAAAQYRWNYVLDGMVKKGWLSSTERQGMKWPQTADSWSDTKRSGQGIYIDARIKAELAEIDNVDPNTIGTSGYKIYTSLNSKLMKYAELAVKRERPKGAKVNNNQIRAGLVAVNPANGEVVAFYGGDPSKKKLGDAAFVERPQVGSSFKPYVMATALKQGNNVKSLIDGRSPICLNRETGDVIPGKSSALTCGRAPNGYWMEAHDGRGSAIPLTEAMAYSINTSFVRLGLKVGDPNHKSSKAGSLREVIKTAQAFGLPVTEKDDDNPSLPLGVANIPAVYQASGYAAFANGGYAVTPHIITKITHVVDGKTVKVPLPWDAKPKQVLTSDQAAQATEALRDVVTMPGATGVNAAVPGYPVAGKTGTTTGGSALWFVGFTPQLSVAANVFHEHSLPMTPFLGESAAYGGVYPARIFKAFMEMALKGKTPEQFKTPVYDGLKNMWDTPKPKTTKPTAPVCDSGNPNDPNCQQDNGDGKNKPGCTMGNLNNCDPNKPPQGTENDPPQWWCTMHQDLWETYQACKKYGNGGNGQQAGTDTDGDGIPDATDPDDDNDGIADAQDPNPLVSDAPTNNGNNNGNGNGA
jgi:membrane peptidoglycan carboxypeptidase